MAQKLKEIVIHKQMSNHLVIIPISAMLIQIVKYIMLITFIITMNFN